MLSSSLSPPFDGSYDSLVAGAGIAGATAAYLLSKHRKVVVVDPDGPSGGASGAAAGLVNPFMGRKARPTWRTHEALDALDELLSDAEAEHSCRRRGVFRPARSEKQVSFFKESSTTLPDLAETISAEAASERFPQVHAPHGGLWIPRGCSVDVTTFIDHLLAALRSAGHTYASGWVLDDFEEKGDSVIATLTRNSNSRQVVTKHLLLCVGQGYSSIESLKSLGLRAVKGQTISVETKKISLSMPALSGYGYVVPTSVDSCIIGSTYEHDFEDLEPSQTQAAYLLEKANKMIPGINKETVTGMRAGARVFPPSSHLPWLGPLPKSERVWFYGGLGSRGLLTAPLISSRLNEYLSDSNAIPPQIRLNENRATS